MTMTRTDLLEIIRNGENSGVEFKRDVIQNQDLAKELVAFSNFEGGIVLLGVEDDGSVSGITRANSEEDVMSACRDKIRPGLIPFYQRVKDVEPGRDVAVVRVSRGFDVHTLWHNNNVGTYLERGLCQRAGRFIGQSKSHRRGFSYNVRPGAELESNLPRSVSGSGSGSERGSHPQ